MMPPPAPAPHRDEPPGNRRWPAVLIAVVTTAVVVGSAGVLTFAWWSARQEEQRPAPQPSDTASAPPPSDLSAILPVAGSAVLAFDVGADGVENAHQNYLLVNGTSIDLAGDHANGTVEVEFPAQLLIAGNNTISVVTGDGEEPCGPGRDDFDLTGATLTLPGELAATPVGVAPSYPLGDGDCGSDGARLPQADLVWTVAEAPPAPTALAPGTAELAFDVSGDPIDLAAPNEVHVNGNPAPLGGPHASGRVEIEVPQEWLVLGRNILEIRTGMLPGTCDKDEFVLSDVTLTLADGSVATGQGLRDRYAFGDGDCGSDVTLLQRADMQFVVD